MSESSKLFDRIHETFRLNHLSPKAEKSYLHYIKDFLRDRQTRSPREVRVEEIRQYLSHLAVEKHLSTST